VTAIPVRGAPWAGGGAPLPRAWVEAMAAGPLQIQEAAGRAFLSRSPFPRVNTAATRRRMPRAGASSSPTHGDVLEDGGGERMRRRRTTDGAPPLLLLPSVGARLLGAAARGGAGAGWRWLGITPNLKEAGGRRDFAGRLQDAAAE
jgi:hypothetical protein